MAKRHYGRELWGRLGRLVEQDDGLICYDCGDWTIHKLFFLCQYLAQTTQVMVGNPKFSSINYIDLFAGTGVCRTNSDGHQRRYPGSALLAAGTEKPFDNLFLVESDQERFLALQSRVRKIVNKETRVHFFHSDANSVSKELALSIPEGSLTIAFIDPYSLDVDFSTVYELANARPLDLIILFADDMDILRNVQEYYYPKKSDKLDRFLGKNADWRKKWDQLDVRSPEKMRKLFADIYLEQLKRIGYQFSETEPITMGSRPLYRLVYASKNQLGLKFWRIAANEDLEGNRNLFGIE